MLAPRRTLREWVSSCLPTLLQPGNRIMAAESTLKYRHRAAYRAVYTVRFKNAVFMLHVFQKKSTRGAATPKADLDLIRERLKIAERFARELLP